MDFSAEVHKLDLLDQELTKFGKSEHLHRNFETQYTKILTRWPYLEGFHIRYAHTAFQLNSWVESNQIFLNALQIPYLNYSHVLWTHYIKFLISYAPKTSEVYHLINENIEEAQNLIGDQFLSHEFWELVGKWRENERALQIGTESRVSVYIYCLTELTLHQVTFFYQQLLDILSTNDVQIQDFANFSPSLDNWETDKDPIREVIKSKLKLQYELHLRRVDAVFPHAQAIHRPFFHPKPLPSSEISAWKAYIQTNPSMLSTALIPGAETVEIRMAQIRKLISEGKDSECILAEYKLATANANHQIQQHYAIYLELQGQYSLADQVYVNSNWQEDSEMCLQYAQYTLRQNRSSQAQSILEFGAKNGFKECQTQLKIADKNNDKNATTNSADYATIFLQKQSNSR